MRKPQLAFLYVALMYGVLLLTSPMITACAGLGVPSAAIATADHVSLETTNLLTVANDAADVILLRVEVHVQAGDIHGADATRVRQALTALGAALDAADAARRLGNDALTRVKTGDAIALIAGLQRDFPVLASALHH